jgi:hypothetical protein
MSVQLLLDGLRQRVPWPTMKVLCKICDLPISKGWDNTMSKLVKLSQENDDFSGAFDNLKSHYCDHLLAGEKSVKIYVVDTKIAHRAVEFFSSYTPRESIFQQAYPLPLVSEKLSQAGYGSVLVEVTNRESFIALVFCTKRSYTERVTIEGKKILEQLPENLRNLDKIYGIKKYDKQFFDVVVFWKGTGLVELRVDTAMGAISQEERAAAFIQVSKAFNEMVERELGVPIILNQSQNLFPLIDKIYCSNEGRVCELNFTTQGGSIKHERMRRSEDDLRFETYHKAGRAAEPNILVYRLGVIWDYKISEDSVHQVELFFPGTISILSSSVQTLDEVFIAKCYGLQDYQFLLKKITTYLEP